MIGQVLGHYQILSEIGKGGMGVVYRARDEVLHRDVALKVLAQRALSDAASRDQLLHEARASSALSHPNVCTIFEVGEFQGELYIVMELVEGSPLSKLIGEAGLPVESVMRYGVRIAAALAHAHSRNLVHRDLKSHNVVVTPEGLVKVLDFGLARRLPAETVNTGSETMPDTPTPRESSSAIAGTLAYMAPEILRGEPGDFRSDLWALGVVLYEAATGQLPFQGKSYFEISAAILRELPAPLPPRIPAAMAAVIVRCLAKEPAQRYQQAGEVVAALDAVRSVGVLSSPQPGPDPRGPRTMKFRGVKNLTVKNGDILLTVGTTKGVFLMRSNAKRARWETAGPYFHGQQIFAMAYDGRAGRRRIWASTCSPMWGTFLCWSDDFGKTWTAPSEAQIRFPAESGASLKNIWQICPGRADEPNVLYCGVEPAALFESSDNGETWSLARALYDHPHRPRWEPGNGGLTLHTILLDPADRQRMYVAISAGGVYVTGDGGRNWRAGNQGVRVMFRPERYPEFGQCVHKIAMHPSRPDRLFLQNHWGLYRSDDGAGSWSDIGNGVPSDFGFPMVVHPHKPDWVYVIPVESDEFRCTPDGRLRVFRSRNAGESWEALTRGLPQKNAYETVVRDAMTTDTLTPAGIYFGTRSGDLYGSVDDGKSWKKILDGLPPVVCVRAAQVGKSR